MKQAKSIADFCEAYNLFVEFQRNKQKEEKPVVIPMTGNQAKFANFLLENAEMVSSLGNMHSVFNEVREFLKQDI